MRKWEKRHSGLTENTLSSSACKPMSVQYLEDSCQLYQSSGLLEKCDCLKEADTFYLIEGKHKSMLLKL